MQHLMPLERNVGTRKDKRIMLTIRQKGDFSKLTKYLIKAKEVAKFDSVLAKYGQRGIDALSKATPVDTGLTASSWYYEIEKGDKGVSNSFLQFECQPWDLYRCNSTVWSWNKKWWMG